MTLLIRVATNTWKPGKRHFLAKTPGKPGKLRFLQRKERLKPGKPGKSIFSFFQLISFGNVEDKIAQVK